MGDSICWSLRCRWGRGQNLCWQKAGGQAVARLSPIPPLSLDFDGVSSLQPRCLEPCPGRLQAPWGLWCSDLPAQLWGGGGGLSPSLDHGERGWEVGWLPKTCEECRWRSSPSPVLPESASEQAGNLNPQSKLPAQPGSAQLASPGPGQWSQTPPFIPDLKVTLRLSPHPHSCASPITSQQMGHLLRESRI